MSRYIPGLDPDDSKDFAILHAHTLYVVGREVFGVFTDSNGCCGNVQLPLREFDQLEYIEG